MKKVEPFKVLPNGVEKNPFNSCGFYSTALGRTLLGSTFFMNSDPGKQLYTIQAPCLGYDEFSLADPQVLAHRLGCQLRGFFLKSGKFLGLWNQGIFR
jgi:hypothetical protein